MEIVNIFIRSDQIPKILTLVIMTLVTIEWIILSVQSKIENQKESWVNVFSAGLAFIPQFLITKTVFLVILFWCFNHKLFDLGFHGYSWILCWLIYDFCFWLIHFLSHKVRLLWCLHNVHHSAKEMKLSVGFRGSLFDVFLIPHTFLWIPFFGFHPFMVLIIDAIGKLYGIVVHINKDWFSDNKRSLIEKFIITPSAHRVHHSTNGIYLDRNYGETFSIWDHLFGTYQSEIPHESPVYGIRKEVNSGNLYESQMTEFKHLWKDIRSTSKISDKIKYILMPPGWNHYGTGLLAKDLRNT